MSHRESLRRAHFQNFSADVSRGSLARKYKIRDGDVSFLAFSQFMLGFRIAPAVFSCFSHPGGVERIDDETVVSNALCLTP